MKKNSQSFGSYFLNAARGAGVILPIRLILSVLVAAVPAVIVLMLPKLAPVVARRLPEYFFGTAFGAAYLFTVIASLLIMLVRSFVPRLFIFDEILSGKWELASRCGANLSLPCLAKALFAFWAPATTYCFAAVLFSLAVELLGGSKFAGMSGQVRVFLVGLLSLLALFALELIFAALGVQKSVLPFISLPFLVLIIVLWYWKGLLNFADQAKAMAGAEELIKLSLTSLLFIAPVLIVLALLICMIVPTKRIDRYVIEDLDDEMLRVLEFREDQEVYEKTRDGFELVFTGKEVLRKR